MLQTVTEVINLVEEEVGKKEVSTPPVDQHRPLVKVKEKVENGVKKLHVTNH